MDNSSLFVGMLVFLYIFASKVVERQPTPCFLNSVTLQWVKIKPDVDWSLFPNGMGKLASLKGP